MAKKETLRVPFRDGNLMSYPDSMSVFKENFEFNDSLKFAGFERGRSAAHAIFESINTGKVYPMFLQQLGEIISGPGINEGGIVTGVFTFCKRGANFGIKYLRKAAQA